jgi:hypothetical protein
LKQLHNQTDSPSRSKLDRGGESNILDQDEEEALAFIELPPETMYLIDKVVRQRSKMGPIGVDNSELINLEIEDEFREKQHYIDNLVGGKPGQKRLTSDQSTQDKENLKNERLL